MGSNEVQLSDMTNQFFQVNIQDTWSGRPVRPRFNLIFLEFFKCNTNSKSVICKGDFLMLTLANFVQGFPKKVSRYTTLHSKFDANFKIVRK